MEQSDLPPTVDPGDGPSASHRSGVPIKKPRIDQQELPSSSSVTSSSTQTDTAPQQQTTSTQTHSQVSSSEPPLPLSSAQATLTTMTGLQQQPMVFIPLGPQTSLQDSVTSALLCRSPCACCVTCTTGMSPPFTQAFAPTMILDPFAAAQATLTTMTGLPQQPRVFIPLGPQTSLQDSMTSTSSTLLDTGVIVSNPSFGAPLPTPLNLLPFFPSLAPVAPVPRPILTKPASAEAQSDHVQLAPEGDLTTSLPAARQEQPPLTALTAATPVPGPTTSAQPPKTVEQTKEGEIFVTDVDVSATPQTTPTDQPSRRRRTVAQLLGTSPTPNLRLPIKEPSTILTKPASAKGQFDHVQLATKGNMTKPPPAAKVKPSAPLHPPKDCFPTSHQHRNSI
ncbi:mucin-2-like [Rhipicephalus sanguineus]|uniref:mucin-2-like n=1 Tax=Rhipicephalus sanguineus TaxID=34632 RepID=UPI0020C56EE8|nr:mucin-2-like [Rhipicephalus sanguineus]